MLIAAHKFSSKHSVSAAEFGMLNHFKEVRHFAEAVILVPRLFFFSLDAGGSNPANVMPGDFFGILWPKIQRLLFLNWSIGNHGNANLEITNNTNSLANMSNALVNGRCYLTNPGETPR